MDVIITLEDRPSEENKRLLEFLHGSVDAFNKSMRMKIVRMKKTAGVELPMAKVGQRPAVYGGKKVIAEIRQTFDLASQMNPVDPVERLWSEAMKRSPDERVETDSKENEMANRFTIESQHRKKMTELRRGNKGGRPSPPTESAPTQYNNSAPPMRSRPVTTPSSGGEYMTDTDPDAPNNLDPDPLMQKFWANQTITAGT